MEQANVSKMPAVFDYAPPNRARRRRSGVPGRHYLSKARYLRKALLARKARKERRKYLRREAARRG